MRKLLDFLIKYNYWFLFLVLEVTSFTLLLRFNNYQKGAFFTSANVVVGKVYEMEAAVTSYFNLRSINRDLMDRNLELDLEVAALRKELQRMRLDSLQLDTIMRKPFEGISFIEAEVINHSLDRPNNYVTLNKGTSDGVQSGMGVVGRKGVVGIVYLTSRNYSVIIPLLNVKSRISCKIANTGYFGTMTWLPGDSRFAYLNGIPRHARLKRGGKIVTSGFSEVFPEGVMVGQIAQVTESKDGLSYRVKVALATDFGNLSDVRIIAKTFDKERAALETEAEKKDDN